MDGQKFDALTKRIGSGVNRRVLVKGFLGIGAATIAAAALDDSTEAARRGFSGPKLPTPPVCDPVGTECQDAGTCCTGLCGGAFATPVCCTASGQSCELSDPGACCSGCCTAVGAPPGEAICC